MDVAFVNELVKDNNGESYLLVRQAMFDRTVSAKRMKKRLQRYGISNSDYDYTD